uniref:Penicillin-binding protein transpeptidase domain-containing protein n=1 Tax=candidate division WOR-3 bacterium TaxID=2052148 RepID=A0A7C4U8N3_UNCW3
MKRLIKRIIFFLPLFIIVYKIEIKDICSNLPFIISQKRNFEKDDYGYYLTIKKFPFKRRYKLTLDRRYQGMIDDYFDKIKTDYISFFLVDLENKEIIGFYERGEIYNKPLVAASLFKIITTIAALKSGEFGFYDYVVYKGDPHSTEPFLWEKGKERLISFKDAFGTSNNPAFGIIGRRIGIERIKEISKDLFLGENIRWIRTGFIIDTTKIEKLCSGIEGSFFSPLYTLFLTSGISNNGSFFIPKIVKGGVVYNYGRLIDNDISNAIIRYSESTTLNGTARRSFRRIKSEYKMGGKTGSLTGYEPFGRYEWFVGWGPTEKPEICVVVLGIFSEKKEFSPNETGLYFMKLFLER